MKKKKEENTRTYTTETPNPQHLAAHPPRKRQGGVAPCVNTGCNQKRHQTIARATLALAHLADSSALKRFLNEVWEEENKRGSLVPRIAAVLLHRKSKWFTEPAEGPDHLSSCPNKHGAEARSGPVFARRELRGESERERERDLTNFPPNYFFVSPISHF